MKTKIKIKSVFRKLLFEYEKEDNSIKKTLIEAVNKSAYLRGAYLTDADKKIKIKKATVFTGLYKYIVIAIIDNKNSKWVKMGCYLRKLKDWEKDFWNNPNEFLDHESEESRLRLFAFEIVKKWFEVIK